MSEAIPGTSAPTTGTSALPPPGRPTSDGERTLGQLVVDASHDLSTIVRAEVALAKAELTADLRVAVAGAAMFAVAGVLGVLALVLLLFAAAYGLVAAGLSRWLAFVAVAGVLLVVAAILALVAKTRIGRAGPPERTLRTTRETVQTLKGAKPHPG